LKSFRINHPKTFLLSPYLGISAKPSFLGIADKGKRQYLCTEAVDVANIDDATITSHENLLLGTSTWGAGEMQDDWYDGVKTLKSAGLAGKTVALFGCGDSESYPDTFCGGMKELYDAAVEAGATVLPGVSTDGYTYDDSEAIDGDKFLGLALDEVNEDDKTEERIDAWLEAIKPAL